MSDDFALVRNSSNDFNLSSSRILPRIFPLYYRIVASSIHAVIFIVGVFGNLAVVFVVRRTRILHTPTYCYLVSLAVADLLVLISAVPEAIVSYHIYAGQWVLGHAGCSLLIFGNFLGINASSTSILCFTVERYIGICKPMLAQKVCSVQRSRKIILLTWGFAIVYSSPWLGLTHTQKVDSEDLRSMEKCELRLRHDHYISFFMADLILFYVIPLIASIGLYAKIGVTLHRSQLVGSTESLANRGTGTKAQVDQHKVLRKHSCRPTDEQQRQVVQMVRMLLAVVILFAVLWLPYRALLVYNSLAPKPLLNLWYLFFAKSSIFVNSAINPIMYNAMSKKFRSAFMDVVMPCLNSGSNLPDAMGTKRIAGGESYSKSTYSQGSVVTDTTRCVPESPQLSRAEHSTGKSGSLRIDGSLRGFVRNPSESFKIADSRHFLSPDACFDVR